MYHNTWIDARHLFVSLAEDITKFFEQGCIDLNLIRRTRSPYVNVFNNPRFDRDVDGHGCLNFP